MELGRYLSEIDRSLFEDLDTCDAKCELLADIISTPLNFLMPERKVKFHTNDAPWVTKDFKRLIMLRQRAFHQSGNLQLFKLYHNKVNRERELFRAKNFATKVSNLKKSKLKTRHGGLKSNVSVEVAQ